MQRIRWGIIGAGNIARSFAQDVHSLPDAEMLAVASRSVEKAKQFASDLNIPRAYGSYIDLVSDPDVNIVYVATPHVFHREHSLLCLAHGKPVLVEKPFAMTAADAEEVITAARERNLFCMEAMWTRFIPAMRRAVEVIESGELGDIVMISASLGFYNEFSPEHRLFNPKLGGGALLDLGVYPLSFIIQLLGRPSTISSTAILGDTGVDEYTAVLLGFPGGQIAQLATSIRSTQRNDAFITGTRGVLHIHPPLNRPTQLTISPFSSTGRELSQNNSLLARMKENEMARGVYRRGKRVFSQLMGEQKLKIKCAGNGYVYEIAEAGRCLRAGQIESDLMPSDETLAVMHTMDAIRQQWQVDTNNTMAIENNSSNALEP